LSLHTCAAGPFLIFVCERPHTGGCNFVREGGIALPILKLPCAFDKDARVASHAVTERVVGETDGQFVDHRTASGIQGEQGLVLASPVSVQLDGPQAGEGDAGCSVAPGRREPPTPPRLWLGALSQVGPVHRRVVVQRPLVGEGVVRSSAERRGLCSCCELVEGVADAGGPVRETREVPRSSSTARRP
jgi:hypothetical protein